MSASLKKHGKHIDVLSVSCDSFHEDVNIRIGRGSGDNVAQLFRIADCFRDLGIKFKLNTVVCAFNHDEDMSSIVATLAPFRWKVFQCLLVESEINASQQDTQLDKRRPNAKTFLVTDEQYAAFCDKHEHVDCFGPEPNNVMANSYLILD